MSRIPFLFRICIGVLLFLMCGTTSARADVVTALQAVDNKRWETAYHEGARLGNGFERDLFNWFAFVNGDPNASFSQINSLIQKRSDWPSQSALQRQAERKMPLNFHKEKILQFFSKEEPLTGEGATLYVKALQSSGQSAKAKKFLNSWWPTASLSRQEQKDVFLKFSGMVAAQAHIDRLNRLVFDNRYEQAMGIATVLNNGYPQLVKARKALRSKSSNVESAVAAVPAKLQNNEGLLFDRLQWRRKKELNTGAIEILNRSPSADQMVAPKLWWKERHIIVRRLIEQKKYQKAYAVASGHKQKEGFPKSQAEWVSGWLALRFINQPWKAFEHFESLYNNVKTPISLGRGAYWAGRASEQLGHADVAAQWYGVSAKHPQTFYGQLAAQKLGVIPRVSSIKTPSNLVDQSFLKNDLVKAAKIFHRAGLESQAKNFLMRLYMNAKTPEQHVAAARAAREVGYSNISIQAAQEAQKEKNINYIDFLYPTVRGAQSHSNGLESAAVYSIIRQESRFDQRAISHAGARGLMQLMPATAKETARKAGLAHQKKWLTQKPLHNIRLGSTYLKRMVERYGGHYGLAAAAYNAGPGRVDNWLREFGDPRTGQIDWLDWFELIPIYETRNYVQRVLENIIVYREVAGSSQVTGKTHLDAQ